MTPRDVRFRPIRAERILETQKVMSRYVTSFDPRFIGLVPSEEALKRVAGQFKVFIPQQTE